MTIPPPGPDTRHEPPAQPQPPWQPANDTERAMVQALLERDRREYFRLVAVCDLYLPAVAADRDRSGPQRFITAEIFGQTYLPVFTSVPALAVVMAGRADAYTVTNYSELRRKWPSPEWRLAVNLGTPIDAYVTIEAVQDAAVGDLVVPSGAELFADGLRQAAQDANAAIGAGAEAAMREAVDHRDVDGYLRALLDADVIVPVAAPVDAERIVEPGFPWRPVDAPGEGSDEDQVATIQVFTSAAAFQQGQLGPVASVTVPFAAVLLRWPGDEYQLAVDPGTVLEITVPGRYVRALAMWLPEASGAAQAAAGEPDAPPAG